MSAVMSLPDGLKWVSASNGDVPPNTVSAGPGSRHYIGRAGHSTYQGNPVPGKIDPTNKGIYIPSGNQEHFFKNYEALVQTNPDLPLRWVDASGGYAPPGSIPGGGSEQEPLYIGRTLYKEYKDYPYIPGKVDKNNGTFYFPSGNKEHRRTSYQILVVDKLEVKRVDFQLDQRVMGTVKPKVIAQKTVVNKTETDQTSTFSYSETVSTTSRFSHEVGATVTVGTKFSAGIPVVKVASAEWNVEVTGSYSHTWGEDHTTGETFSDSTAVKAPPNARVFAKAVIKMAEMDVPYTMHYTNGMKSSGTWKGVSAWDMQVQFEQYAL